MTALPPSIRSPAPYSQPSRRRTVFSWLALPLRKFSLHRRCPPFLLGLILLHLAHQLSGPSQRGALWFAPAGVALALMAWLGPRALLLVAADVLLVALQSYFVGLPSPWGTGWLVVLGPIGEAALEAVEAVTAWWCYHRLACGARNLGSPRSATLFLLVVPALLVGFFAVLRGLSLTCLGLAPEGFVQATGAIWASRALGIVTIAPALLAGLTPVLGRWGTIRPTDQSISPEEREEIRSTPLRYGDVIEIGGLSLSAALFSVVLILTWGPAGLASGQPWATPLLLIVWAALRQGMRGGTVVAAAATIAPLTLATWRWPAPIGLADFGFQGNLLTECSMALLVAASSGWVRASEARYRRVVGHIPVLLYSVRIDEAQVTQALDGPERGTAVPDAEIIFLSPACRDVLGCDPQHLLGPYKGWLCHVHPLDREIILAAVAQLSRQDQPVTCEYRLAPRSESADEASPHSTGRSLSSLLGGAPPERWVRDTLAPHLAEDGRLDGWEGVVTDITEQRLLAGDLRRASSMLDALVANLPAGVFFVQGAQGRPILVNARARQLLGQAEDGTPLLDHLVKAYRLFRSDGTPYPLEDLPVNRALRLGQTSMRDDIVVHRPDGRRIPLVTWAAPIDLAGNGRPDAAVWVLEDVGPLHQAEAALRESETRLRAVIETIAEGLVVQDQHGTILSCNAAASAILELPAEKLVGRPFPDPALPCLRADGSSFPAEEHPAPTSLRSGEPVRGVVLGIPCPAGVRWILVNAMPLTQALGRAATRAVTTFVDITAHRQATEVLRHSEEKYRGLVETLPVGLVQFDQSLHILYLNPALHQAAGYAIEDVQQPPEWQAAVHPEDLPRLLSAFASTLTGCVERLEVRFQHKDGANKVALVICQPRQTNEEIVGISCLVVDITREQQLEQELQRSQRVELVGQLASGVAHDFNNLLTVILSLAELTRGKLPAGHPVLQELDYITEAGQRAANLAEQLLAFGKQRRLLPQPVEINRMAARTMALLRSTLANNIHIDWDLAREPLQVLGDETQLQQLLMNLCLNARDAMPKGGQMVVRTVTRAAADAAAPELPAGSGEWVVLL